MTAAVTTIENVSGTWHTLPAPLQGVLAPGQTVHSTITLANLATLYNCTAQALQRIPVTGITHPALPIVASPASVGQAATSGLDDDPDLVGRNLTVAGITASATVSAEQLTSTDDATVTDALTAATVTGTTSVATGAAGSASVGTGGISTTGDLSAAGGFRQQLGPFIATLAAGQTAAAVLPAGVASAPGWVAQRAGSITGFSAAVSAAVTGADQSATVKVRINGTAVAAANLAFTQAGAETEKRYAVAKDVALHTFAAGDNIDVVYDSDTITNTPVLSAWVEIEQ